MVFLKTGSKLTIQGTEMFSLEGLILSVELSTDFPIIDSLLFEIHIQGILSSIFWFWFKSLTIERLISSYEDKIVGKHEIGKPIYNFYKRSNITFTEFITAIVVLSRENCRQETILYWCFPVKVKDDIANWFLFLVTGKSVVWTVTTILSTSTATTAEWTTTTLASWNNGTKI